MQRRSLPRLSALAVSAAAALIIGQGHALADQNFTVNITSYGYNDNDDGNGHYGTAVISYPQIHSEATEGSGTYDDPSTFATDAGELSPGTIIYVPHLQKYFIMEDGCVECSADWQNGKRHVDLWMGPASMQPEPALDDCEAMITRDAAEIVVDPPSDLPVDTTPMFSDGQCTAVLHDNARRSATAHPHHDRHGFRHNRSLIPHT